VRPWLCKIYYCKNYGPRVVEQGAESRLSRQCGGGVAQSGSDERGAVAGELGNTVDARDLNGLGEGHRRQDGGEAAGSHRLARPRRFQEQDVMGRTPAWRSPSPLALAGADEAAADGRRMGRLCSTTDGSLRRLSSSHVCIVALRPRGRSCTSGTSARRHD
jgi:hypothetical protein